MNKHLSIICSVAAISLVLGSLQGCSVLNAANKLSNSIPGSSGLPARFYSEPGQAKELLRPEGKVLLASFVLDREVYPDRGKEEADRKDADAPGALNDTTKYWAPARASIDTLWKLSEGLFTSLFPEAEWIDPSVLADNAVYQEKTVFKPVKILGQSTQLSTISSEASGLRYLNPLVASSLNAVGESVGADWILVVVNSAKVGNYTESLVEVNTVSMKLDANLNLQTTLFWHKVGDSKLKQEVNFGALSQTRSTVINDGVNRELYPQLFAEAYTRVMELMKAKYQVQ